MQSALPKVFGLLLIVFGISMLPPALVSRIYDDGYLLHFLAMAGAGLLLGAAGMFLGPKEKQVLRTRDGFLTVALSWLSISILGAIPFVVVGKLDLVTAFFESASGFTTTGSTAIPDLDVHPMSLLFMRQEIQWLGGIGVIVSAIALLPILGMGGMQLMKAEATGPAKSDKLHPRVRNTAQAVWGIYMVLTIACALAFWFAGMPAFDAISHSLATVSTGGFSIYDESIGYYESSAIESVAAIFMFLGAINFAIHFRAWNQKSLLSYLQSTEVRAFAAIVAFLILLVWLALWSKTSIEPYTAFRLARFEVISVITSTGFGIADFSVWPAVLPVLLIFISFVGGCAGSTAGGMKVIRFLIMFHQATIEMMRLIHPSLVRPLRIGDTVVEDSVVRAVWAFFTVYVFVFVVLMLALMWLGLDQITAFSAIATCLNNLGPGLGDVAANFAGVSDAVKIICAIACILGRLEILTIFVLLTPGYWRP